MARFLALVGVAAALRPQTRLFAAPHEGPGISVPRNVLGGDLECCCADVRGSGIGTGFYRDGHCSTGQDDEGRHTVCIEATSEFLEFSASVGNDLSTPNPQWMFPGVMPGDQWCLCAARYAPVWKSSSELGSYAIEPTRSWGTTSRRWRGTSTLSSRRNCGDSIALMAWGA